jgi:oligoendopeptidase F
MVRLCAIAAVIILCSSSQSVHCDVTIRSPTPNTVPEWDLGDLYPSPDSEALASDLREAKILCLAFAEDYKDKLQRIAERPDGANEIAKAIERYDRIIDRIGRIYSYAKLTYSGDISDPIRSKFYQDIQERYTTAATFVAFFPGELNKLDAALLQRLISDPLLTKWRPWLRYLRMDAPYQLSPELEQLFQDKSLTSQNGWRRLFDQTIASLRFTVAGQEQGLDATLGLLQDSDEITRRSAYEAIAAGLSKNMNVFVLVTNMLAKDKAISDDWRKFSDSASSRHLANHLQGEVVANLVAYVRESYPRLAHRYYGLKAGWLHKDKLDYSDVNAPLPFIPRRQFSWSEAREVVLTTFGSFSPEMGKIASRFFEENWIDASTRPGKESGAFSFPVVPSSHPYILLNYRGRPRDVVTLGHEVGHGVHQYLAAANGALMATTPVTLAETAAAFSETLVFRGLLKKADDKNQRRALLAVRVEHGLNAILRQVALYSFEQEVHRRRADGELTEKDLGDVWLRIQKELLGPSVRLEEEHRNFWAYIPQFIHSPFYVYSYAFGNCLGYSLSHAYEINPEEFPEKYLNFLRAGGTQDYDELLAPFGVDITDRSSWKDGLSTLEQMISELESMGNAR